MSQKNKLLKKMRKGIRHEKEAMVKQIALEMLTIPFWQRLKLALKIIWRPK